MQFIVFKRKLKVKRFLSQNYSRNRLRIAFARSKQNHAAVGSSSRYRLIASTLANCAQAHRVDTNIYCRHRTEVKHCRSITYNEVRRIIWCFSDSFETGTLREPIEPVDLLPCSCTRSDRPWPPKFERCCTLETSTREAETPPGQKC